MDGPIWRNRWSIALTTAGLWAALVLSSRPAQGQLFGVRTAKAQQPPAQPKPENPAAAAATVTAVRNALPGTGFSESPSGLRVSKGSGTLPNTAGQLWREYDLSPYTSKITGVERPEQAVIDWVLRETGVDLWFQAPVGVLSADSKVLRVYHTPQMHAVVRDVVERFVGSDPHTHVLSLRIVTVGNPAWRTKALAFLKPVDVQTTGVEAWMMSRESAAVLYDELRRRPDAREFGGPSAPLPNGQTLPVVQTKPRAYARGIRPRSDGGAGMEVTMGQIDEGFTLSISPLMSADGKTSDIFIKCNIDQIEKLVNVPIEVPLGTQTQRLQIQTPQMVSWRLQERFRWPSEQVLVLGCGVVADPTGASVRPLANLLPIDPRSGRADALLFIEYVRRAGVSAPELSPGQAPGLAPSSVQPGLLPGVAAPIPATAVNPFLPAVRR